MKGAVKTMYNFFVSEAADLDGRYSITGADFNHIKNVLRMRVCDTLLVSCDSRSDLCTIVDIGSDTVTAGIVEENYRNTELGVKIYLFQGLPKSDKMELIIQKCVELGVHAIVPVEMSRCVVKLDEGKKNGKISRWQAISESAAKQSKRNTVPEIMPVMSFKDALKMASELDIFMVPYENKEGMLATKKALEAIKKGSNIGIMIGPEGGFDEREIDEAIAVGGASVSLGKRILRTETAAMTALSMCMLYAEMNLGDS